MIRQCQHGPNILREAGTTVTALTIHTNLRHVTLRQAQGLKQTIHQPLIASDVLNHLPEQDLEGPVEVRCVLGLPCCVPCGQGVLDTATIIKISHIFNIIVKPT